MLIASVAAGLVLAAPAQAAETAVLVVDSVDRRWPAQGAVGLMVPGSGAEVSRRGRARRPDARRGRARAHRRRARRRSADRAGRAAGGDHLLRRGPAARHAPRTTGATRSRSSAAATAGCSSRARRGFPASSRSPTSRTSAVALEEGDEPPITSQPSADPPGRAPRPRPPPPQLARRALRGRSRVHCNDPPRERRPPSGSARRSWAARRSSSPRPGSRSRCS